MKGDDARPWRGPRLGTWAVLAVLGAVLVDAAQPDPVPVRLVAAELTPDEAALVSLMDPADRARYLLQRRIAERAELAALLSELQARRHATAMQVIENIR